MQTETEIPASTPTMKSRSVSYALIACILMISVAAVYKGYSVVPQVICKAQLSGYSQTIQPLTQEWQDASKLAISTPRLALAAQINNLQSIRRRIADVQPPNCAREIQGHLITSTNDVIDGLTLFLGQQPDSEVTAKLEEATKETQAFTDGLKELQQ